MNMYELQQEWEQLLDRAEAGAWEDYKSDNAHRLNDYDPSPYCQYCGALKRAYCHCGPISANH